MGPLYERSDPVVLKFSLQNPLITEGTYTTFQSDVLAPLLELLCDNGYYVMSSRVSGQPKCPMSTEIMKEVTNRTDLTNGKPIPYFGNPNMTVLLEAPVIVEDQFLELFSWTSWTVHYYVAQTGETMVDMATMGSGVHEGLGSPNDNALQSHVHLLINRVLQLALQVSILDGELGEKLNLHLPGAHLSLPGDEITSWTQLNISRDNMEATGGLASGTNWPEHELLNDDKLTSQQDKNQTSILLGDGENHSDDNLYMSTVATTMYHSKGMRNFGFGLFLSTLLLLLSLTKLAQRRRNARDQAHMTLAQGGHDGLEKMDSSEEPSFVKAANPNNFQLASERGVLCMLSSSLHNGDGDLYQIRTGKQSRKLGMNPAHTKQKRITC